jgi:hypothetical protein
MDWKKLRSCSRSPALFSINFLFPQKSRFSASKGQTAWNDRGMLKLTFPVYPPPLFIALKSISTYSHNILRFILMRAMAQPAQNQPQLVYKSLKATFCLTTRMNSSRECTDRDVNNIIHLCIVELQYWKGSSSSIITYDKLLSIMKICVKNA